MRVLVTGAAGFVGYHAVRALLERGHEVVGVDNLNAYYDPELKRARLARLDDERFTFVRADIADREALEAAWSRCDPQAVLHLAAQAGVRYSLEAPMAYVTANLVGFQHVIELVRARRPESFVYASSSSVYGANATPPFREDQRVDCPLSLYAATKISNELVARSYAQLYGIPSIGLRFFTVYGPYGRPDMAFFRFAEAMLDGRPIEVYNRGHMSRDFTYIDDIVAGTLAALERPASDRIYNLGRGAPTQLLDAVRVLERCLGVTATLELLPLQPGDMVETCADIERARADLGYEPRTSIEEGLARFARWFVEYRASRAEPSRRHG